MIGKSLVDVEQADIEALKINKVVELATLEYKRDIPSTDDQRREIVYDIISLANTRGGDLLFGIDAERDANNKQTGAPGEIVGVAKPNLDDLKLRLLQMLESCAKPRISGVDFAAVGEFKNGPVVIVRVPATWNGPHMMHFEKSQRFYARTSAGRYLMDVDQIRAAMLASASLPDRLDSFRRERLAKVAANQGAIPLSAGAIVLFHVVPFASLTRTVRIDPSELAKLPTPLISMAGGGNPRVNFDGYLLPSTNRDGHVVGYVQAFRSGVLESVMAKLTEGNPPIIGAAWFENTLVNSIRAALQGLNSVGVAPPYYVAVTLAGVRDALIATSNTHRIGPIDRETLLLPDVQVERATLSVQEVATALRPAFDVLWQAAGAQRSFNFDNKGIWSAR